jgi:hypothetical protein
VYHRAAATFREVAARIDEHVRLLAATYTRRIRSATRSVRDARAALMDIDRANPVIEDDWVVWPDRTPLTAPKVERITISDTEGPDLPGSGRNSPPPRQEVAGRSSSDRDMQPNNLHRYATTLDSLPVLPEGYGRVVHITKNPGAVTGILKSGLRYSYHGTLFGTARVFGRIEDARYDGNGDPRFSGPGATAIVMDVPFSEIRLHSRLSTSPGRVPPEYIIGVIDVSRLDSLG